MKKQIFLITLFLALVHTNFFSQSYVVDWVSQNCTPQLFATSTAFSVDNAGNSYVTGYFSGTVNFDPNSEDFNFTSNGGHDVFIMKINANQEIVWVRTTGGTETDRSYDIKTDILGNVYIIGNFSGTVDFDPTPNNTFNYTSYGDGDIFVQKLNSSGDLVWFATMGGTGFDLGYSLALDNAGNVYTCGFFSGTADFAPFGVNIENRTSTGQDDCFIQKLNSSGVLVWAKTFGSTSFDSCNSIAVDNNGNVYATGRYKNTCDFDASGNISNHTSNGGYDLFTVKYDTDGNFQWSQATGSSGHDHGLNVIIDNNQNPLFSGYLNGSANFGYGGTDIILNPLTSDEVYLQKFNNSGAIQWAKNIQGALASESNSIAVNSNNDVFLIGDFFGTANFNTDGGTELITSTGDRDIYIEQFDETGNYIEVKILEGAASQPEFGKSIIIDSENNMYLHLKPGYPTDLDFGTGLYPISAAQGSVSIVKYNLCYTSNSSIDVISCDNYTSPSGTNTWSTNGIYEDIIPNNLGCDSVITINLTILNSSTYFIETTACNSYLSPSGVYTWTESGLYQDTLNNTLGCDSIITTELIINVNTTSNLIENACNSYTSLSGLTWTESGIYNDLIPNSVGCDSLITIELTILESTSSSFEITLCNEYLSPSGITWSESGIYEDIIPNSVGCDSIITIDLTILESTSSSFEITLCNEYLSPSGITWSESGIYEDIIPNSVGCDSIITIELTITESSFSTIDIVSCTEYTSPSGIFSWAESGSYEDIIPNTMGCDSIITINLTVEIFEATISNSGLELTANIDNATYLWLDCDNNYSPIDGATSQSFVANQNGNYSVEITQNGCSEIADCFNVNSIGIEEQLLENLITVHPNPNNGRMTVDLGRKYNDVEIIVLDIHGKIVEQMKFINSQEIKLDLNIPSGNYFLKINSDDLQKTIKIIIE